MDVEVRRGMEQALSFITVLVAGILVFPLPAYAVEVGCFCTFIFVSTMVSIGIGMTLIVKFIMSKKIWKLSFKWMSFITGIEVVLMFAVLIAFQTKFYIRVLIYLPLAFLLNYAMIAAGNRALKEQTATKRAAHAALSCVVLPLAVQIVVVLFTYLSNMITFKEVSL